MTPDEAEEGTNQQTTNEEADEEVTDEEESEGLSEEEIADMTQDVEDSSGGEMADAVNPVEFQEASSNPDDDNFTLDLLMDVELPVRVELGRTKMSVDELLEFSPGSVVELDKMAGEPAELYIRDTFFARGEVVVVDNNFGLRITDLSERAREIGADGS